MAEQLVAVLRYHPLGPTAGTFEPIRKDTLAELAKKHGVDISVEDVVGANRQEVGGKLREETMDSTIETVSQTVVTMKTDDEKRFREAMRSLLKKYGAPRTTYGTWGSSDAGRRMIAELADEYDGWA